jgi:CarD family transcriptional regulator
MAMEYSVGDRVVHPHHGPGRISGVERKELMDGAKRYYVIDIPRQALTVQVPVRRIDEVGVRPAMAESRFPELIQTLGSRPRRLPDDHKERQEQIGERLRSGRVMQLAKVVRDLTWHRDRAHLTRRDADFLKAGQALLAAELAMVCGDEVSEAIDLIESTMAAAVAGGLE